MTVRAAIEPWDGPLLELRGISKSFHGDPVLTDVSLSLERGQVAAIIGPSGGGKSTLLRCVNYLAVPDSGQVLLEGRPVGSPSGRKAGSHGPTNGALSPFRTQMPMVFQRFHLFPHMTALANVVEAQIGVLGRTRDEAVERSQRELARVGMDHRENAYPATLSGGEQQRVAIARALALDPQMLLLDEPTSALDPELVGEVLTILKDLAADGLTMLMVTHELAFARETADRVYFLDGGRVVEWGSPAQLFESPQHDRTARFIAAVTRPTGGPTPQF